MTMRAMVMFGLPSGSWLALNRILAQAMRRPEGAFRGLLNTK